MITNKKYTKVARETSMKIMKFWSNSFFQFNSCLMYHGILLFTMQVHLVTIYDFRSYNVNYFGDSNLHVIFLTWFFKILLFALNDGVVWIRILKILKILTNMELSEILYQPVPISSMGNMYQSVSTFGVRNSA